MLSNPAFYASTIWDNGISIKCQNLPYMVEEIKYNTAFFNISISHLLQNSITKTCLYNFDPLKPHFYIVKLGFTGLYNIFLISAQKHRLRVLIRTASESTHNLCFWAEIWKISEFLSENFQFFGGEIFIYLNRLVCFCNVDSTLKKKKNYHKNSYPFKAISISFFTPECSKRSSWDASGSNTTL